LRFGVHAAPLVKPYELSFGDITCLRRCLGLAEDDDAGSDIGEAVPLPGL